MNHTLIFRFKTLLDVILNALAYLFSGLLIGAMLLEAQTQGAGWSSQPLPQYDRLFQQTNDWIGADGDFTVALTNGLTLWLFSDTFIGQVRDGHRIHSAMIHNSAAWQHGVNPTNASVEFFHGRSSDGKSTALIAPVDGKGWFWLADGVVTHGKLVLFLTQIEPTDDKSVFGFRQIGAWLGKVSNPLAPPAQWQVTQIKIPFASFGAGKDRSFGSALLATNGFIYIFGIREQKDAGKHMILARAPDTDLGNFASWQFRTSAGWSTNAETATDLCGGMATEFSVSWLPSAQRYVLICTENGLSEKIMARTAMEPWGPWSSATVVYRCPEAKWDKRIFCYTAKAHPMLSSATNELIVTYAANSFDLAQVLNDARLYWPRFVRVKLLTSVIPAKATGDGRTDPNNSSTADR
jgi:hypothetical protein